MVKRTVLASNQRGGGSSRGENGAYDPQIFRNVPSLSDSSKRAYDYGVKRMMKLDTSGKSFMQLLNDPMHCLDLLRVAERRKEKPISRKTLIATINAMVAYMEYVGLSKSDTKLATVWQKVKGPYNKNDMLRAGSNIPTDRQREAHVAWPSVLRKLRELSEKEYGSNDHLVLAMFTMIQPRRPLDYFKVKVITDDKELKALQKSGELKKMDAWIDMTSPNSNNKKPRMVINKYKTLKAYGPYETTLPKDLADVIAANLQQYPDKQFLFSAASGHAFKAVDVYTFWLNARLKHVLNNKHASANTMRHSYISFQHGRHVSYNQMVADARAMGHSISTALRYRLDLRSDDERNAERDRLLMHDRPDATSANNDMRTYQELMKAASDAGYADDIAGYIRRLESKFSESKSGSDSE
jgi:hypothetical protein